MAKSSTVEILFGILTASNLGYFIGALLLFGISYQVIYNNFFHPLCDYPGPFLAATTRIWIALHNYFEDETAVCWKLIQQHGPVVRISPNLLLVAKAEYLPQIYHRRSVKTNHYNLLGFGRTPSVFHEIQHENHVAKRRMVASAYNFLGVKGLEQIIDRRSSQWISELKTRFDGREAFDFSPWATFLALDIIGEVLFDKDIGCVEKGRDEERLNEGFKAGLFAFGFVTRMHVAAEWVNWSWIGRFLEWQVPRDQTIGILMRYGKKVVKERLAEMRGNGEAKRNDMLQRLIDARSPEGEPLDSDSLHAELTTTLLAGADTISTTSCEIIIRVLQSPNAFTEVLAEYKRARDLGSLSPIPQQSEVLEHCPYYVACVKESMRISPSVQSIFPREIMPDQNLVLEGKQIPPGTEVACNPWIIHRDPRIYGSDASVWRPERWLEDGGEAGRVLEKYNLALGFGSRICLGRDLGMMELMKFPLMFLTTFDATFSPQPPNPMRLRCRGGVTDWENVFLEIRTREV